MHQLHDAEVAQRLLYHLARAFGCPDAVYLAGPMRIQGGFDAAIFGFTLDRVPPPLVGPLILRLSHADADPGRVKLETVVQNTLAEMGFPAPRVMVTESDPGILGGPFMVMTRLSGQTLAHGIEGLGAGTSLVRQLQLLFNLPAVLARIIDQWVDMQIRLHQLPAETLLRAVTAAGIDAGAITFEGQLARLSTIVERSNLIGLKPGLTWLDDHRPPPAREAAICHGDFHPLNILADKNQPTGVIDWANAVIAEPAMDVGSAISNMSAVPLPLPWALRVTAHAIIGAALRRYERTYRALRPLDDRAVRYYQVFRAVAQMVGVGRARTTGRVGGGAFHSAAGVGNLIALIKKLSSVSVSLEDRMRLPKR
ncbi:phosphotransferase [Bradyrhizobium algeriense]|uniref:phosphotransferase n=1 Tax=Bradyrhizobium algeriense TaxID=634784 RepID=UPI000D3D027E|nr:phosphotransferase [Bradyrhizobium algeriense]